jgi:hypothetical protein
MATSKGPLTVCEEAVSLWELMQLIRKDEREREQRTLIFAPPNWSEQIQSTWQSSITFSRIYHQRDAVSMEQKI